MGQPNWLVRHSDGQTRKSLITLHGVYTSTLVPRERALGQLGLFSPGEPGRLPAHPRRVWTAYVSSVWKPTGGGEQKNGLGEWHTGTWISSWAILSSVLESMRCMTLARLSIYLLWVPVSVSVRWKVGLGSLWSSFQDLCLAIPVKSADSCGSKQVSVSWEPAAPGPLAPGLTYIFSNKKPC